MTEQEISALHKPGDYAVGGIPGLELQVKSSGARSWILRMIIGGRRRELGLGPYPLVDLARARHVASIYRLNILQVDLDNVLTGLSKPVTEIRHSQPLTSIGVVHAAANAAPFDAQPASTNFRECAGRFISNHQDRWRNPKHVQQWRNTFAKYVYPFIGDLPVNSITVEQVLSVLQPSWDEKNETFRRIQNRLEQVFNWAASIGLRSGKNPAQWRNNLDQYLSPRSKRQQVPLRHLSPAQMPKLMLALAARPELTALCLSFVALTLCKARHVRFATWDEIDFKRRIWTIPVERNFQSKRKFEVYLSDMAIQVLNAVKQYESRANDSLVFPSPNGRPFSDAALSALLRRMNVDAVPDGFRTTFTEWFHENCNCDHRVLTNALGRAPENSSSNPRFNLDGLKQSTRTVLERWSAFCMRDFQSS